MAGSEIVQNKQCCPQLHDSTLIYMYVNVYTLFTVLFGTHTERNFIMIHIPQLETKAYNHIYIYNDWVFFPFQFCGIVLTWLQLCDLSNVHEPFVK